MATTRQIEANRRNSQKSTGPRTADGKAVSRFNALQTGIHAASLVIPGEDPAALADLTTEYHHQFRPCTCLERFLVDTIVTADWELRRLRKIEAQLWTKELTPVENSTPSLGEVFDRAREVFTRLQRAQATREEAIDDPAEELQKIREEIELGSFFPFGPPPRPGKPADLPVHVDDSLGGDRVPGPVAGDQPVLGPAPR